MISHCIKEIHTLKEENDEVKTKINKFLQFSDADVEESMFFLNADLKLLYQKFLTFPSFINKSLIFLKLNNSNYAAVPYAHAEVQTSTDL